MKKTLPIQRPLLLMMIVATSLLSSASATDQLPLTINEEKVSRTPLENVTVLCTSKEAVIACRMKVGSFPPFDPTMKNPLGQFASFQYHGRGLKAGECGVTLDSRWFLTGTTIPVVCWARTRKHDWLFRTVSVETSASAAQPQSTTNIPETTTQSLDSPSFRSVAPIPTKQTSFSTASRPSSVLTSRPATDASETTTLDILSPDTAPHSEDSSSSSTSEHENWKQKEAHYKKKLVVLYIVIGLLVVLLVTAVIIFAVYTWCRSCCCCQHARVPEGY